MGLYSIAHAALLRHIVKSRGVKKTIKIFQFTCRNDPRSCVCNLRKPEKNKKTSGLQQEDRIRQAKKYKGLF